MLTETCCSWPSLEVSSYIFTYQVENDDHFPTHEAHQCTISTREYHLTTVWLTVCTSLIDFDSALSVKWLDHFNSCKLVTCHCNSTVPGRTDESPTCFSGWEAINDPSHTKKKKKKSVKVFNSIFLMSLRAKLISWRLIRKLSISWYPIILNHKIPVRSPFMENMVNLQCVTWIQLTDATQLAG